MRALEPQEVRRAQQVIEAATELLNLRYPASSSRASARGHPRALVCFGVDQNGIGLHPGSTPTQRGGFTYLQNRWDVALVLARQGTNWWVKQRPVVGGVDQVLAGRYSAADTQYQNLALVADRRGARWLP